MQGQLYISHMLQNTPKRKISARVRPAPIWHTQAQLMGSGPLSNQYIALKSVILMMWPLLHLLENRSPSTYPFWKVLMGHINHQEYIPIYAHFICLSIALPADDVSNWSGCVVSMIYHFLSIASCEEGDSAFVSSPRGEQQW